MKSTRFPSLATTVLAVGMALAGCSWRLGPEFTEIRYSVTGTAQGVVVTAVVDEIGTLQTFSGVALPWSLEYTNETHRTYPPVYLRIEAVGSQRATGASGAPAAGQLVDLGASFAAAGVLVGDYALNRATGAWATVTVVAPTTLNLSADVFPLAGQTYSVCAPTSGSLVGRFYGDGALVESLGLDGWLMAGVVVARNFTAP